MIKLQRGDLFATENPMALGKMINFVQKVNNLDNKSKYTHIGLITDKIGITFEALWTYKNQNIYTAYGGKDIIIFRNTRMTEESFNDGMRGIKHLTGRMYPFYRLPLFLLPFLAKISIFKKPVCSELIAMFLYFAGLRNTTQSFGIDPDDLVDRWRIHRDYEIVFEGTLTNKG